MREHRELKRPEPTMSIPARLFLTWGLVLLGLGAFAGGLELAVFLVRVSSAP